MKDNRLSIRFDHEVLPRLVELANKEGTSVTKLINKICRESLCAYKESKDESKV